MSNLANKRRARTVTFKLVRRVLEQASTYMVGSLCGDCLTVLTSISNTAIDKYLKNTQFDCDISSLFEADAELKHKEILVRSLPSFISDPF